MSIAAVVPRLGMLARIAAFTVLLFGLAGCVPRLVGTNDVALVYRFDPDAGAIPADVRVARVRARLAAAQISVDLEATTPDGLRVVVDQEAAATVRQLLAWRGGVTLYELAPDTTNGTDARTTLEQPQGAPSGEPASRPLAVKQPPLLDLSAGLSSVETRAGATLLVHLRPDASEKVAALARRQAGTPVAIARDRTVLTVAPLDASSSTSASPLVVAFPRTLYGYARAQAAARLLASPELPPLTHVETESLPVDAPLAGACVVLPMLLSLAWVAFVRRFDRAHPEPVWMVSTTFALGGLSVVPAGIAEYLLMNGSPFLNPKLATLGGQVVALPFALAVFTVVVGISEEGSKFLAAWVFAYRQREFDEPVDGIVYGATAALGFAAVENVEYFASGRLAPMVVIVRTFMAIPAHMFFGSIWGYAMGRKLVEPTTRLWPYVLFAAFVHGAFDTFLSIDGLAPLAIALNLGLASLFVVLLRRALRHGVVDPSRRGTAPTRRALHRVGSPLGFAASAIALHVLAFLVLLLGAWMEAQRRRVGFGFIGAMSSLVVLLGAAAHAVSRTLPLDVAIDEVGITFAGALRAWETVRGIVRERNGIVVRSTDGDIWIGPAPTGTLDRIDRSVDLYRHGLPVDMPHSREDDVFTVA